MTFSSRMDRRELLRALAAAGSAALLWPRSGVAQTAPLLTRRIPSSNEELPVVGLGSWGTFNVGEDRVARDGCAEVLRGFFAGGGRVIDSSPMYGSSQQVIGYGLEQLGRPARLFAADKVWISSGAQGPAQIEESRRAWRVPRFDLLQVHNLMAWEEHLPTLFAMKAAGTLRYVGITTSHGRRHGEVERIMRSQPLDFVQVTYNVIDREVEDRILPLAQDRGVAVIINRPFQRGELIERVRGTPLPPWAAEIDCTGWPQVLLKFIVSHPAVTCAIPATSKVAHVQENMGAARGRLPDEAMRRRLAQAVKAL
jgi:diketogulonate reductase-like aldo/keto reductase